jgi:hypothetical protein
MARGNRCKSSVPDATVIERKHLYRHPETSTKYKVCYQSRYSPASSIACMKTGASTLACDARLLSATMLRVDVWNILVKVSHKLSLGQPKCYDLGQFDGHQFRRKRYGCHWRWQSGECLGVGLRKDLASTRKIKCVPWSLPCTCSSPSTSTSHTNHEIARS